MRKFLLPFNILYRIAVYVRNKLYDYRLLKISSLNAAVISVGNISTGGTGKTPMTEYLAEYFLNKNKSIIILTKGYKRIYDDIQVAEIGFRDEDLKLTTENFGDESLLLLDNLFHLNIEPGKGLLVVSDDKRSGARLADKKFKPEIVIIDDGFQQRSIERKLDIVMLNDRDSRVLLPAGNLREPFRNTKRADVLVLNKKFGSNTFSKLETKRPSMIVSTYKLEHFVNLKGEVLDVKGGRENLHATAFCGIADPESFKELLICLGINPENFIQFPDHHNFKTEDIKQITYTFERTHSKYIFTTQKDLIRLKYSDISKKTETEKLLYNYPLYYAKIKLQISKNEERLHEELNKLIKEP